MEQFLLSTGVVALNHKSLYVGLREILFNIQTVSILVAGRGTTRCGRL